MAPFVRGVEDIYSFVLGHLLRVSRDKAHPTQDEPTAGREVHRFSCSETLGEIAWSPQPGKLA